jgi:uncharacterized membrane protein
MSLRIISFLNIILAGLLAGTSFGIWMGFNPVNFSALTYIEQQQNTIRSLNTLMISLVVTATVLTVISAFLRKKNKRVFITLLTAAVFFIACILISKFGNQPINDRVMTWKADSIPANWTTFRDEWWSFHIIRTISELIALFLIVWVSISKRNSRNQ